MNSISLYIAKRLNSSQNRGKSKIGFIIAVLGISISIITVLLTLSIVDGFKKEITKNIMGFESPLYIINYDTDTYQADRITLTENLERAIKSYFPNSSVSSSLQMPAMIRSQKDFDGIILKSALVEEQQNFISNHISEGFFPIDSINEGVAISRLTARSLQLNLNDPIDLIFFTDNGVKYRKSVVCGIYDTKFADYDRNIAFINPSRLRSILHYSQNQGSRIDIYPDNYNIDNIDSDISKLNTLLNSDVYNDIDNGIIYPGSGIQDAASFFNWLKLLDTNVEIIIVLMSVIAVFTLISSLITIVLDRIPMIGILKSLGTREKDIRGIFILTGIRIVVTGILIADVLAGLIIFMQNKIHFLTLNPDDYYISYVPMVFNLIDFIIINLSALILSFLVMLLPVRMTSKISPASVIKFL